MSYFRVIHENPRTLFGVVKYVKNENKTDSATMDGFGVLPESAFEEMDIVKKIYNQADGRQYKHFVFSFDSNITLPIETLKEICYQIGCYYANDYQILSAIHFDTNNIHCHYILNTVNMFDGTKFSMSKGDIYDYKKYINQILESYNLSKIELYDNNI